MKMILMIDGKEIDAIAIPRSSTIDSRIVTKVKDVLAKNNDEIIDQSEEEPQYAIEGVPSRINFFNVIEKATKKKKVAGLEQ